MAGDGRFAVLADVHGNGSALRTVLARLDELGIARVFHLGDLVGYGSEPAACVGLARERGFVCVQGNHDAQVDPPRDPAMRPEAAAALDYARAELSDDDRAWLAALPTELSVELPGHPLGRVLLVHGALTGRDDYILTRAALADNEARLMMRPERAAFFGHTHLPFALASGTVYAKFAETRSVPLDPEDRTLANPGSVGQPRDGQWKPAFAHVSADGRTWTVERLSYPLAAVLARQREAGLPEKLGRRLALGR